MIGLPKYVVVCAMCLCWATTINSLPAQQTAAREPDEGAPPQPSMTPNGSATQERLSRIATLFAERCLACHGGDKQEGNYSVATLEALRKSGDSGARAIVAGRPEASELYRRLVTSDSAERMPAESEPLESEELALVQAWIADGAKVPNDLGQRPLAQWPHVRKPIKSPEHYPAPLPIAALAIDPKSGNIFTSGYGEVLEWNPDHGELIRRRPVAGAQIAAIETSRDGRLLAVSSGTPGTQGFVEVIPLDAPPGSAVLWSHSSADTAADIAFAPDTGRLAIGQADGSMLLVELRAIENGVAPAARSFTPHADAVLCVAWSESGDRLITGSRDRTAKIFDGRTMELIANYDRHQRAVGGVGYTGAHPISFDETGQLRLWTGDDSDRTVAEQGNLPRFLEHLCSTDKRIYLADGSDVRVFRVEKKQSEDGKDGSGKPKTKTSTRLREQDRFKSDQPGWIMALSQTSGTLAAGTESGDVIVWKNDEPKPKFQFRAKP